MSGGTPIEANPARGESALVIGGVAHRVRPTFEALVAAEGELGSLFALVERAAAGQLRLAELVALFWHCLAARDGVTRDDLGQTVIALGLAEASKPLRTLLAQILQGEAGPVQ